MQTVRLEARSLLSRRAAPPSQTPREACSSRRSRAPAKSLEMAEPKEDAVDAVLRLYEQGDFFQVLGLPWPQVDAQGGPLWQVADSELHRAYKRRSKEVHPDKHSEQHERATSAFEALNDSLSALQSTSDSRRRDALHSFSRKWFHWMQTHFPDELASHTRSLERSASQSFAYDVQQQMSNRVSKQQQRRHYYEKRKREVESDVARRNTNGDDEDDDREECRERESRPSKYQAAGMSGGPSALTNRSKRRRKHSFI